MIGKRPLACSDSSTRKVFCFTMIGVGTSCSAGGGGGCCAGGGVCDDACGTIAVVTASAVARSMSVFKAFIRPPIELGSSVPAAMRPARPLPHVAYDASCCREMHWRDNSTYYEEGTV